MEKAEHAGALNHYVRIVGLHQSDDGAAWTWETVRGVWVNLEYGTGSNLFSSVGIGARDCTIRMRRQPITLHQAIQAGQQHIFLTHILPGGDEGHLLLRGALVRLSQCRADADEGPGGCTFPAVLTEKYIRYGMEQEHAINRLTYVLVTPKEIVLQRGGLVTVDGVNYEVLTAHTLDEYKTEYEIERTEDL